MIEKELLPGNLLLETPKEIRHLDKAIMLVRECPTQLVATEEGTPSLPSYRTICTKVSKENVPKSNVFYLPFLHEAPNYHATVEKSLRTFMVMSKAVGCDDTVVMQDLFIYQLAQEVKIKYPDDFKNVILRMGGFHLLLNYLKAVGKMMESSGLKEIIVQAKLLLPVLAKRYFKGKATTKLSMPTAYCTRSCQPSTGSPWKSITLKHKKTYLVWTSWVVPLSRLDQLGSAIELFRTSLVNSANARTALQEANDTLITLAPIMNIFDTLRNASPTFAFCRMFLEILEIAI